MQKKRNVFTTGRYCDSLLSLKSKAFFMIFDVVLAIIAFSFLMSLNAERVIAVEPPGAENPPSSPH